MKKIFTFIILFCFPILTFAYSDKVILGGQTLGIDIKDKGILIVGFYDVNNEYINQNLKIGDRIIKIADETVYDVSQMITLIEKHITDNQVDITINRNDKNLKTTLELKKINNNYKTGLYVKNNVVGIGTLTYIDPTTKIYGALGHIINESRTNQTIEIREGTSYYSNVTSIKKSIDGDPGSKNADINYQKKFGTIEKNTTNGIFGKVTDDNNKSQILEVGNINDVQKGEAYIYTSNNNNEVKKYKINILKIDKTNQDKNYYFEVVDKELLKISGGIVQGMSGSPIVQNNKIIGAVTRVVVDDVKKGYGINIKTMLEEGEE